jgi:phosphatidylserine/phosphatidylglycerophosphate/cardiolipin synthase-like enzyme
MPDFEYLTGEDIHRRVLAELVPSAKDSLLVATATLKAVRVPLADRTPTARRDRNGRRDTAESIVHVLARLAQRGVQVRILHSGVPSGPFLEELKEAVPISGRLKKATAPFQMRRCPRTHFKAVIVDGKRLYLGSANLTGAGLGAKSDGRRNFEVGLVTDDPALIDEVADLFEGIWSGAMCKKCQRQDFCPNPLETPWDE